MDKISLRQHLEKHGAIYGKHYTIGGLGDGIFGIERMSGFWYSYEAKSGRRKTNYVRYDSEAEACMALIEKAKQAATETGHWKE